MIFYSKYSSAGEGLRCRKEGHTHPGKGRRPMLTQEQINAEWTVRADNYNDYVADELTTYFNYYRITPDNNPDVCSVLVSIKLKPCLMYYAGITDESELKDVDFSKAFSNYLLSHGMTPQQLQALIQSLTSNL